MHVYGNYSRKISTSVLNDTMLPEIENYPPPAWKGKYIKIKYVTQLPTAFPCFAFSATFRSTFANRTGVT